MRTLLALAMLAAPAAHADPWAGLRPSIEKHLASLPPSRVRNALEQALTHLGAPYIWGADDRAVDGGYDCVGFIYQTFHDSGLEFPLARWSTMNMTPIERGEPVPKRWWTEYTDEFAKTMQDCKAGPFQDGDVLVYHALDKGKVVDRTGHVVIALDAKRGFAVSAARSGVHVHALGNLKHYDGKDLTACWRAPSAAKAPFERPALTWTWSPTGGDGTMHKPYVLSNPISLDVTVKGPGVKTAKLEVLGRVNAFIGAVHPQIEELPSDADTRTLRLTHDFKKEDLRVDPGETIRSALRKIVVRLVDDNGFIAGERSVYVRLKPYW